MLLLTESRSQTTAPAAFHFWVHFAELCRIRLLGVPPWRFALGWQNRSMSGPLLMLVYMISQGAVAGNGPPVLLVRA